MNNKKLELYMHFAWCDPLPEFFKKSLSSNKILQITKVSKETLSNELLQCYFRFFKILYGISTLIEQDILSATYNFSEQKNAKNIDKLTINHS